MLRNLTVVVSLIVSGILLTGCGDLLATYGQAKTQAVEFTLDRGIDYCVTFPEDIRMDNRAATDLGLGPIIEVHCERIPVS